MGADDVWQGVALGNTLFSQCRPMLPHRNAVLLLLALVQFGLDLLQRELALRNVMPSLGQQIQPVQSLLCRLLCLPEVLQNFLESKTMAVDLKMITCAAHTWLIAKCSQQGSGKDIKV